MHTHCNHQIRYQKAVSVWKIRRAICLPCGQPQIIKKKKKRLHTLLHVNVFVLEPLLRSRINGWKKTDRIYRVCSHPQHSKHFAQEVLIHTLTHSKWNKYLTHFDERGKLALTHIQADLTSKSAPK